MSNFKMRYANNVGVAARYDQDHVLAVEFYLKAFGIAQSENDLRNIAISSNGLGNSLSYLDPDSQEAMSHFRRALQAERDRSHQRGTAMNLLSIASYHTRLGNYSQALTILKELLTINPQINDTNGIAITYEYFGHNYLEEGLQTDQAVKYYQQSLELFKALNNRQKMADLELNLGQTAEIRQQIPVARRHYQQALAIAEEGDHKSLIAATAERLSHLNESAGDYRLALLYHKKAEAYNDSLDLIHQQSVIQGLKMQYDFGQKENEIQLLRANQQSNESSKILAGAGLVYAADINNLGVAFKGVYAFTPEWEGAFGFTHILKKDSVSYNVVDLDAQYIFSQSGDQVSFFAIGGLALTMWKVEFTDDWGWGAFGGGSASGSDIGLNLGADMNYMLSSNFRLVPEVRFTIVEGSYARIGATAQYVF